MRTIKMQGILTDKFPQQPVSQNLVKRVFWLRETDRERYPQHWELELHNDECRRLDEFKIGEHLEAEVELRGRKYEKQGREGIFNSLKCVGLGRVNAAKTNPFKN